MNKKLVLLVFALICFSTSVINAQETKEKSPIDSRIDNMGYWKRMAKEGYVPVEPVREIPKAIIKGSKIKAKSVRAEDSPDVPVNNDGDNTQSETSIFVDPTDNAKVLNSNNSTSWSGGSVGTLYGASYLESTDFGLTWGGSIQGAGGSNSGDPAAVINLNGRQYVGFIHSNSGQGVSYSDDGGVTWTSVVAGTPTGSILDKNHLWVDNSPTSPHVGNVYDAWTDFNNGSDIYFVRSTDDGLSYSSTINLSSAVAGTSHDQGVNIQTGPNGEVYATWAIYDGWPTDETAIGFAKSTDGGASFPPATRIITNIKGIRTSEVSKNQRVNSFPSMAVDISGGADDGNIYIVWTNIGVPGTNTGTNRSVYMAKSTDEGTTWETPVRVNQGTFLEGKEAYFPWITCDPETGVLSVIFYDDRDVSSTQVEAWVANSYDAGVTWEDFRVSDVAFTPQPISGLAGGYMGDYLGISARGSMVYPVWPDNRNGYVQTFVSPFETNNRAKPTDLNIVLTFATGQTDLTWNYTEAKSLQHFVVYRDNVQIGTSTTANYTDMLPSYGIYQYSVTAMHEDGESSPARNSIQWGDPQISVIPTSLTETLLPDQTSVQVLTVENTGELDLTYNVETAITTTKSTKNPEAYCTASGGGTDEYISGVVFGSINNTGTGQSNYSDYTAMSAEVDAGNTYPITITNGEVWSSDDLGVWIDWNQDEDFDDAGEEVVCEIDNGGQGTFDVVVPSDALGGSTRMRVRIKFSGSDCGDSCGTTSWGEVEDYTVNVNSWLQVATTSGTVLPGSTELINVNFDSTDLALGDYFATITFNSNDTGQPQIDVPVTLHVVDTSTLAVNATADVYDVCSGASTILHANPTGGTGTYTFSWTSVPAGFTSSDENPSISPLVNTVYTVSVFDGVDTVTSDVSITVIDVLGQPDTPVGDTTLCQDAVNTTYTTNTVAGATSYQWTIDPTSAGTITGTTESAEVNWDTVFSGAVSISVSALNTCGPGTESDLLAVTINELPTVSLATFDAVCLNTPAFVLSGGDPTGGTYSGVGVTNDEFDPVAAGVGTHTITYAYADANGCENFATQDITVNAVPTVTLSPFSDVFDYDPAFELTGGLPAGGTYSGVGVSGGFFDPAVAGPGIHTIIYTYSDANGCEDSAEETIEVISTIGIDDLVNNISFNIYPNPNNGTLFVDIKSKENKELNISFYNQLGVKMKSVNIAVANTHKSEFDIKEFAQGVYFVSIKGEKINFVRKIIVQ